MPERVAGFRRRPSVGLAVAALAGTAAGLSLDVPVRVPVAAAALLLMAGVVIRAVSRRHGTGWHGAVVIHLAIACCAWALACSHPVRAGAIDVALPARSDGRVVVEAVVAGEPRPSGLSREGAERRSGRARGRDMLLTFPVTLQRAQREDGRWIPARGRVQVRWYGPWEPGGGRMTAGDVPLAPSYGQRWQMSGVQRLRTDRGGRTTEAFIVRRRNVRYVSDGHGWRPAAACYAARRSAAEALARGIADCPGEVGVLRALLLGYRSELEDATLALFRATGTLHVFAISGLHVGMIAGILIFALTACGVSRVHWVLYLAPLLIGYTLATGAKASAVRACVMALAFLSAPLLGRRADSLSALAAAALLILAASPAQLHDVGFIYSFVVVLALIVLFPHVERPLARLCREPDAAFLPPEEARQRYRWRRRILRYAVSLLAVSITAWLASAPLTARFFGRMAPVAVLSNLFVIPLAFLTILSGCLSLVLGSVVAVLGSIFNNAALALVSVMMAGIRALARVPFGSFPVPPPPVWLVAAWYAVLSAVTLFLHKRREMEREKGIEPSTSTLGRSHSATELLPHRRERS